MATNPLIAQGSLNRLIGSLTLASFQALNVTSPYLGKRGIGLELTGQATDMLPTMTGMVTSPEPYMPLDVTLALVKSQPLAAAWLAQVQLGSVLGNGTVYPDVSNYSFSFFNAAVTRIAPMVFDGSDPTIVFTLSGYYPINSAMWNLS